MIESCEPKAFGFDTAKPIDVNRLFVMKSRILLCLAPLLMTINIHVTGQTLVTLSQKHIERINKLTSPQKKMARYRKYFKKDSVHCLHVAERHWKGTFDSLHSSDKKLQKVVSEFRDEAGDFVNSKVYRKVYMPWAMHEANQSLQFIDKHNLTLSENSRKILFSYFFDYFLKSTERPDLVHSLKSKFPGMEFPKQLEQKINSYDVVKRAGIDLSSIRTFDGFKSLSIASFSKTTESLSEAKANVLSGVMGLQSTAIDKISAKTPLASVKGQISRQDELTGIANKYTQQVKSPGDSNYLKNKAREQAEQLAAKYLSKNPQVIQGIQRKMSLLMKKYSIVPNSNDLSTAVKRTSLEGHTILEHLQVAGNFQVISLKPVSIDFAPQIGWKINSRFVIGVGGLYRKTFSDSLASIAPDVFGLKGFTSYEVLGSFFVAGEFARNSPSPKMAEESKRVWENALILGIGRKLSITPKLEMTLMAGYNLTYDLNDTVYSKPWVIRVGLRSSELAFINKRRIVPNLPN